MSGNGQLLAGSEAAQALRWERLVLTAADLRHSLNGSHELIVKPRTVITPLAAEELKDRGVQLRVSSETPSPPLRERGEGPAGVSWGYAAEWAHPLVQSAVRSLRQEGIALKELANESGTTGPGLKQSGGSCQWARALAECIATGECCGGVVFCQDPGMACCVANKRAGLRAVPVVMIGQAARALLTLGANLLAVEMPGRTFFEIKQILKMCSTTGVPACPAGVACTLLELDGHAHR